MQRKRVLLIGVLCTALILFLSIGYAWDSAEMPPGYSGRIQAGVGYMTSTDQLRPNNENELNGNLNDNSNRFDSIIPFVLFDLRYTFTDSGKQIYLGTPIGSEGPPGLTMGAVLPFSDDSEIDLSVFGKPFGEVWEDPYLVNEDRDETDQFTYGTKIVYKKIMGTAFKAHYSVSRLNVNNDEIGKRFEDLERDGWLHNAEIGHSYRLGRGMTLAPSFEFSIGDLDGDANSFTGYQLQLGLRRFTQNYSINLSLGIELNDYNDEHPIFDKNREDLTYSVFGIFTLSNLFSKDYLFCDLLAGYKYRDSNISFLDADTFLSGLMIGYKF